MVKKLLVSQSDRSYESENDGFFHSFYKVSGLSVSMYRVIGTETYLKEISKWTKGDREAADKIPKRLSENPFAGDPLGYRFLREKRIREKRVYYLIYEDLNLVLLVAASAKKKQQTTINHIKTHLNEFRVLAEKISKQAA